MAAVVVIPYLCCSRLTVVVSSSTEAVVGFSGLVVVKSVVAATVALNQDSDE